MNCGVLCMSFLYDTYIIALVPDGSNKLFPASKIYLWDTRYEKNLGEYEFYKNISYINYMRDILVICQEGRIIFYDIQHNTPLKYI
jgi:hypothetical protein